MNSPHVIPAPANLPQKDGGKPNEPSEEAQLQADERAFHNALNEASTTQ
jgi:hypothetical protein